MALYKYYTLFQVLESSTFRFSEAYKKVFIDKFEMAIGKLIDEGIREGYSSSSFKNQFPTLVDYKKREEEFEDQFIKDIRAYFIAVGYDVLNRNYINDFYEESVLIKSDDSMYGPITGFDKGRTIAKRLLSELIDSSFYFTYEVTRALGYYMPMLLGHDPCNDSEGFYFTVGLAYECRIHKKVELSKGIDDINRHFDVFEREEVQPF